MGFSDYKMAKPFYRHNGSRIVSNPNHPVIENGKPL